ncbi:hypothetical protein C8R45DRAFT_1083014 [Mycena sanguinolenta]|nr:hypothetical protein C8R45DRAFT_1083014 [Mycena sanguinolenta]
MAVMLSAEESALVIFGSILDSWVHKAAKSLADASHFAVIVRPLNDDPTRKWSGETYQAKEEEQYTHSSDSWDGDNTSILESEDEMESIESDAASLNLGSGVYRLRGGAGKDTPAGPPHHLGIHLGLKYGETVCDVPIICKTWFTCHTQYEEDRPQVVSSTKLIVRPNNLNVQPDRSYSTIGFFAHAYISGWRELPFDQHIPPYKTTKPGAAEIPPKEWIVDYKDGAMKLRPDHSYIMQDVSYAPTNYRQGRLDVKFSMGIDVGTEELDNHDLPKVSFIIQNLTFLFICNKALRAQGYGMVVVTSSYIPDIQTDAQCRIRDYPVVDVVGDQLNITTAPDITVMDPGPLSVSFGLTPTQDTSSRFTRYLGCHNEGHSESQLLTVPLHEIRSRGWDIMMEQWKETVCPKWGDILQDVLRHRELRIGNMNETQHKSDSIELQDAMLEERNIHNYAEPKWKQHDSALQAEGTYSNIQANFTHKTLSERKGHGEEDEDNTEYRHTHRRQQLESPTRPPANLDDAHFNNIQEQLLNRSWATHMALPRQTQGSGPNFFLYGQNISWHGIDISGGTGGMGGTGIEAGGKGGKGKKLVYEMKKHFAVKTKDLRSET